MPTPSRQHPSWADDLLDLAAQEATGRVVVVSSTGEHGWLHLRDGALTGVSAATRRPLLSRRLTAFEVMSGDDVRKALDSIRQQPGVRLVDILIDQRMVPSAFIESYLRNTMAEQLGAILNSSVAEVRYEPGRVQRVSPLLMGVHEVLATAAAVPFMFPDDIRDHLMQAVAGAQGGPAPIHRSVLTASDGHRRPVDVADLCGLTAAETLQVIAELQQHSALELTADPEHDQWHGVTGDETLSLAPATGELVAEPVRPSLPPSTEPETLTLPAAAAIHPRTPPIDAPPPPMPAVKPFAPAPVEPEIESDPVPAGRGSNGNRREALSALKDLTDAVLADSQSEAGPPPAHEPQAEVTTTSPHVWSTRPVRPANPMESGDVLRELKSLGDS